MWELIVSLLVVGFLLVFVEIFVPGAVAGIIGGLALLAAIVLTYVGFGLNWGNFITLLVLMGGGALFYWWMRTFSSSRLGQQWTLDSTVPVDQAVQRYEHLKNEQGRSLTALRPAGTALIAGQRIDVIAQGDLIDAGVEIKVVSVEGPKVVVRKNS